MDVRKRLEKLQHTIVSRDLVCPEPPAWHRLWEILENASKQSKGGPLPAPPLILNGWAGTTAEEKRERLFEHLNWAAKNDCLERVDAYLRNLTERDWFSGYRAQEGMPSYFEYLSGLPESDTEPE